MDYTEVTIECAQEDIDGVCEKLTEMGCGGFVIENEADFKDFLENNRRYWDYVDETLQASYAGLSRVKCYLEDNEDGQRLLNALRTKFDVSTKTVCDSDWENNWKEFYKPLEIGKRLVVVPEWEAPPPGDRVEIRLDPGLMFGTGSHATTRMCLAALEKYAGTGKSVLDLGCGSGILGIGALVLGSDSCVGCDIDPKAPDIVMENAALNGIGGERMRVLAGDVIGDKALRKSLGAGYDIVLANIVSDVIIPLAPHVRGFMAVDATFITSGIIDGREAEVEAALKSAGFEIRAHHHEEEWHCFECR